MIMIAYFLLLRPGENTGFKSYSTTFQLEDITSICGRSVFGETENRSRTSSIYISSTLLYDPEEWNKGKEDRTKGL